MIIMEKSSDHDHSKTWEEEMYWKHFHTMHFYQILPKDFHHHLVLPRKFAENMSSQLPQKLCLIGPSGSSWDVELSKTGSLALVGDGWKSFIETYGLEERSLLFFKYKQNSSFEILIFDQETLCEKEETYFAKRSLEKEADQNICRKRSVREPSSTEVMEDGDDGGSEFVSSKKPKKDIAQELVPVEHRSNTEAPRKPPSDASSEDNHNNPDIIVSSKSREDVVAVYSSALENNPRSPKSCVSKKATAGRGKSRKAIVPRKSSTTSKAKSAKKPSGRNNSREPSEESDMVLTPLANGQTEVTDGVTLCSPNNFDVYPDYTILKIVTPDNGEICEATKSSQKSGRKPGRPAKGAHQKAAGKSASNRVRGRAAPNEFISNRRPVTDKEKQDALARANKALDEKSFIVVMRPTCVYKRFFLNIPTDWMNKNFPLRNQKVTLRVENKSWALMFNWYTRKTVYGGFTGGWKRFVMDNNLEEFDVCVFKLTSQKDDAEVVLDVKICRVVEEITPLSPAKF